MRCLITRALVLLFVLTSIVSTAPVVGQQQPVPRRVAMLHLTDCELPCWIGITPGKTTLADAMKRVSYVYSVPGYTLSNLDMSQFGFEVTTKTSDLTLRLLLTPTRRQGISTTTLKVTSISLSIIGNDASKEYLALNEVLGLLPPPEYIALVVAEGGATPTLLNQDRHIRTYIQNLIDPWTCMRIARDQPVLGVDLSDQTTPPDKYVARQPWQGFRQCYDLDPNLF